MSQKSDNREIYCNKALAKLDNHLHCRGFSDVLKIQHTTSNFEASKTVNELLLTTIDKSVKVGTLIIDHYVYLLTSESGVFKQDKEERKPKAK